MEPCFKNKEIIQVKKANYSRGDVIVFLNYIDNQIIVHRILKNEKDYFICKGDNSFRIEKVKKENILGKVTKSHDLNEEMLDLSLLIGYEFIQQNYNIVKTKQAIFLVLKKRKKDIC